MKKLFSFVIACMTTATMVAQSSLLATLSHNGQISIFYGATAFQKVMDKADHGDVITLSAGQFTACDITKAVTIHGAGMSNVNDSINSHGQTVIQGGLDMSVADETTKHLNIEGVYFSSKTTYSGTLSNAKFSKCRFYEIDYKSNTDNLSNASFIHCRVAYGFSLGKESTAYCKNSIIWDAESYYQSSTSLFEFNNCFVYLFDGYNASGALFKNCAIAIRQTGYSYDYKNLVGCNSYNSIGCGSMNYNIFEGITNGTNYSKSTDYAFKTLRTCDDGTSWPTYAYNESETFELTDEAKTYLGTDGTQVGIYGGDTPYDENPSTHKITEFNVAGKSTTAGKLGIGIKVKEY